MIRFAIRRRLLLFFRHFFYVRRSRKKLERRCSVFAFSVFFVWARFDIRSSLNKTMIGACLHSSPLEFFFTCFAIRHRRRFCFVRHLLNLYDNTH